MQRERVLKVVLMLVGLLFVAGVYPLAVNLWRHSEAEVEAMLLGVYVTLGIFLLLAIHNPSGHRSLISFTAWSSLAHAAVMAVQAAQHRADRGELLGGVALFVVIAAALIAVAPAQHVQAQASAVDTQSET